MLFLGVFLSFFALTVAAVDKSTPYHSMYDVVHKFAILLEPSEDICFYQYFEKNCQVYSQIKVEDVGVDIGMQLRKPNDARATGVYEWDWQSEFSGDFSVEMSGDHAMCFSNTRSYRQTQVGITIIGYNHNRFSEYFQELTDLSDTHMAIQGALSNVSLHLMHMQNYVSHSSQHKATDMRVMQSIDSYILKASSVLSVLVVFGGMTQVYAIQKLFGDTQTTRV